MKILSRLLNTEKNKDDSFLDDRRFGKRYDVPLKLDYYDPATKQQGEALTKNICSRGLRFPVSAKIPKGSILDLKIEDPYSAASILSKARVVWTHEFVTGDDAEDVIYETGVKLLKRKIF
ncbi:MAG: PilZ domain-containing protein [Candidatus Omnitrophica bacterium]|nr:PilZ domain-containing protein [Candidatus Omnitrophota bacterium]MBU4589460.1 PilZ domain-containing protein [Candidatus Omnitrophota bacterium]